MLYHPAPSQVHSRCVLLCPLVSHGKTENWSCPAHTALCKSDIRHAPFKETFRITRTIIITNNYSASLPGGGLTFLRKKEQVICSYYLRLVTSHCRNCLHYPSTMAAQDKSVTSKLANKPLPAVIKTPPQHTENAALNPPTSPAPQSRLYECFVRFCQSCIRCMNPEDNDTADGLQVTVVPEGESKRGHEGTTSVIPGMIMLKSTQGGVKKGI